MATYSKHSIERATPRLPVRKAGPTRRELLHCQNHALDGLGSLGSMGIPLNEIAETDAESDSYFERARQIAIAKGEHEIAELIAHGLKIDAREGIPLNRIHDLRGTASASIRKNVRSLGHMIDAAPDGRTRPRRAQATAEQLGLGGGVL